MQLVRRPAPEAVEIDRMRRLVDAIAAELWTLYSTNGSLNWEGVERHLELIAQDARRDVLTSQNALIPRSTSSDDACTVR